ncbi:hypothetical protein GCM10027176_60710 [Actinoallomurus bryophytorum]|uniref:MYXO-CTERM domain-containing protein n=1 Tax=Actinoallomurus bryophytorum TaxID=1490222 RepID=A0A543CP48_9ACTN|nr:hypothetical protein [Actinoallomurus bryophytorum]TQL98869.1 hypothetical protein FB559_4503 [Actinoallomurus bryophytorum]
MSAADRTRRSPLACLLIALVVAFGLSGAAQAGAAADHGHPVVATATGGQGPQAILDLHAQPRPGEHRQTGTGAGLLSALVVVLLAGRRRLLSPGRDVLPASGRPACGSRAPPVSAPA